VGKVPTLIKDKCIACQLCVEVCPYFAIDYPGIITINADKCFRCGLCVAKCPTGALTFNL